MTYKHIKFEDSVVMRSLERVALQKGLIKLEKQPIENISIVKKASLDGNVSPSQNITENVLKLVDGLRANGFVQYADAVEKRFLAIKTADTHLYRAKDEDGEDMIEFAHPETCNVMPEAGDLGVVENLLEKHKKMVEVLEKQPTGNLDKNAVMQMVMVALGQEVVGEDPANTGDGISESIGDDPATTNDTDDANFANAKKLVQQGIRLYRQTLAKALKTTYDEFFYSYVRGSHSLLVISLKTVKGNANFFYKNPSVQALAGIVKHMRWAIENVFKPMSKDKFQGQSKETFIEEIYVAISRIDGAITAMSGKPGVVYQQNFVMPSSITPMFSKVIKLINESVINKQDELLKKPNQQYIIDFINYCKDIVSTLQNVTNKLHSSNRHINVMDVAAMFAGTKLNDFVEAKTYDLLQTKANELETKIRARLAEMGVS